jgi:hypothetical protein
MPWRETPRKVHRCDGEDSQEKPFGLPPGEGKSDTSGKERIDVAVELYHTRFCDKRYRHAQERIRGEAPHQRRWRTSDQQEEDVSSSV